MNIPQRHTIINNDHSELLASRESRIACRLGPVAPSPRNSMQRNILRSDTTFLCRGLTGQDPILWPERIRLIAIAKLGNLGTELKEKNLRPQSFWRIRRQVLLKTHLQRLSRTKNVEDPSKIVREPQKRVREPLKRVREPLKESQRTPWSIFNEYSSAQRTNQ